jgi:small GTP-binding protein
MTAEIGALRREVDRISKALADSGDGKRGWFSRKGKTKQRTDPARVHSRPPPVQRPPPARVERPANVKCVVIGNARVGKTRIVEMLMGREVEPGHRYQPTIGASFMRRMMSAGEREQSLLIWDTSGDPRFRAITPQYLRGAHLVLVLYNPAERSTFESIREDWLPMTRHGSLETAVVAIVGARESEGTLREVPQIESEQFAAVENVLSIEVTFDVRETVERAFERGVMAVLNRCEDQRA